MILPQEEFAYNNSINRSISKSPFQIVYGSSLRHASKLWNLKREETNSVEVKDFVENLKNIHEEMMKHIMKMNT